MNPLRVGIIGAGYWGPNLLRNFDQCPLSEVVGICDARPDRLAAIRALHPNIHRVAGVDELLALGIDAAVIATPVATHHALARQCLEAGLHVLVEKPLAHTVEAAEELVSLANQHGRVLMVDHTYLFSPAVRHLRDLIRGGDIGDLLYVDGVRINLGLFQSDVNVVWDLAPHDLSIVDFVLGRQAEGVCAWGRGHAVQEGVEDVAHVHIDYAGGATAHFHVSWLSPVKVRRMIFAGTRKSVIFDELNVAEPLKVYDRGVDIGVPDDAGRLRVGYRSGDIWSPHVQPREALAGVAEEFSRCALHGEIPTSDGLLGLRIVRLLEAASQSLRAGGRRIEVGEKTIDKPHLNGSHELNRSARRQARCVPADFP